MFAKLKVIVLNAALVWMPALQVAAQIAPAQLRQFVTGSALAVDDIQNKMLVKEFYRVNGYQPCWITAEKNHNLELLSQFILNAPALGLSSQDYQPALFIDYRKGFPREISPMDSIHIEIKFTDAAIHFIHDLLMGNREDPISYNGLHYSPSCFNVAALLNAYLLNGRFSFLPDELESRDAEYLALKKQLQFFRQVRSAADFKDVIVKSAKINSDNKMLVSRLVQLGFVRADSALLNEQGLRSKVKEAQGLFGLLNDGTLRPTTIEAMNVPLSKREAEIAYTLNTLRWLWCIKQQGHVIVVNIPSATLLLYENGKPVLESRIIVGKRSTQTPTLCSRVTEVILYPYWNVPNKIATKELLPIIKRYPRFLEENNYQVLNNKSGKRLNPLTIDWNSLSRNNFPYLIRQSTGCDNSLGLIKLNFYNPYDVYLHDTPGKYLFSLNKRYFSHGCMRLEKAVDLAHYVLKDNRIAVDTLVEKGCLNNQAPITVPASETIPVFVLYHTAWINAEARLIFHEDVYKKFLH